MEREAVVRPPLFFHLLYFKMITICRFGFKSSIVNDIEGCLTATIQA